MLAKKRVTLNKLLSYVHSFTVPETQNFMKNDSVNIEQLKIQILNEDQYININDFPKNLKNIFDPFIKNIVRYGVNNSSSLYSSVLFLLIENFKNLSNDEKLNAITKLRDKLIAFYSNESILEVNEFMPLNWIKKDVITYLIQLKNNKIVLKIIAEYFHLNIFILNIAEDNIYVISSNDFFDIFRRNIIIAYHDDIFEPIMYDKLPMIDYTNELIKKLVNVDKNKLILLKIITDGENKINFNVGLNNLSKCMTDNEYDEIDENIFVKEIESTSKCSIKLTTKMKLSELQEIALKFNIKIEKDDCNKKKTKNELYNDINKILQK